MRTRVSSSAAEPLEQAQKIWRQTFDYSGVTVFVSEAERRSWRRAWQLLHLIACEADGDMHSWRTANRWSARGRGCAVWGARRLLACLVVTPRSRAIISPEQMSAGFQRGPRCSLLVFAKW
jgi:hypothetical protein